MEDNLQCSIVDNQGRIVLSQKLTNRLNILTLPNLPSGIYIYAFRNPQQQVVKSGKLMRL